MPFVPYNDDWQEPGIKSSRSRKTGCPVCVIYSPNSVFSNSGVSISSQFMLPRSTRPFSVSEKYICRLSFVPNSRFT